MVKRRYKGVFNWYGEIIVLYRFATSEAQANFYMMKALSQKYNVSEQRVHRYFRGKDNFRIEVSEPKETTDLLYNSETEEFYLRTSEGTSAVTDEAGMLAQLRALNAATTWNNRLFGPDVMVLLVKDFGVLEITIAK